MSDMESVEQIVELPDLGAERFRIIAKRIEHKAPEARGLRGIVQRMPMCVRA